jgi:hypothetical protein
VTQSLTDPRVKFEVSRKAGLQEKQRKFYICVDVGRAVWNAVWIGM